MSQALEERDRIDTHPKHRAVPFDPPIELADYRSEEALRRLRYPDGHIGWLVTSYGLAREVLANRLLSARAELHRLPVSLPSLEKATFGKPAPPGFFINMDPPDHTRLRREIAGEFSLRRVNSLRGYVEEITNGHVDRMLEQPAPIDLVKHFAAPIPSLAICKLLGVPYEDHAEFHRLNDMLSDPYEENSDAGLAAWNQLIVYFTDLVRQKRAAPQDDLISGLTAAGNMSEAEIAGAALLLHRAGHETTTSMLALGTALLLQNPDQKGKFVTDAEATKNGVEELLRFLTILQFGVARTAVEDVEIAGQTILAGETVTVSLSAANRDPEKFPNPDELDVSRATAGHLAFGFGIHQCVGQQLARVEMQTAFPTLFSRLPGLRLAVPVEDLHFNDQSGFFGVRELPVSW